MATISKYSGKGFINITYKGVQRKMARAALKTKNNSKAAVHFKLLRLAKRS